MGAYCLLANISFQKTLNDFLGISDVQASYLWYGIFDFLRTININAAIYLSMSAGLIMSVICELIILSSSKADNLLLYYSAATVFSLIWSYKSVPDFLVVSLINALIFVVLKRNDKKEIVLCCVFLLMMNLNVFSGIFRRALGFSWTDGLTMDAWGRIIIYCLVLHSILASDSQKLTIKTKVMR